MPPVPVRIDDPITPTKAQLSSPPTAAEPEGASTTNATTTAPSGLAAYPPARPGAAAVPAPTPYIPRPQPEPTRTQPPGVAQNVPPPPQPGAFPIPQSQQAPMPGASALPPPPKAGETLQQQHHTSMPPQMQVPPPGQNFASMRSTAGYLPPTSALQQSPPGSTTLNLGPVSSPPQAAHPTGYHQNLSAQEMTSAQRSSLEQQERREGVLGSLGGETAGETAGSMWNAVKGWASQAGERLAETEEIVWKRINGR